MLIGYLGRGEMFSILGIRLIGGWSYIGGLGGEEGMVETWFI